MLYTPLTTTPLCRVHMHVPVRVIELVTVPLLHISLLHHNITALWHLQQLRYIYAKIFSSLLLYFVGS